MYVGQTPQEQDALRNHRGCIDQIFAIRQVNHHCALTNPRNLRLHRQDYTMALLVEDLRV